jgi:hypothetical protein
MKKVVVLSLLLLFAAPSFAAPLKKIIPAAKPTVIKKVAVPTAKPIAKPAPTVASDRGFAAKVGLIGGTAAAEIGYYLPTGPLSTALYIGYGFGNKFNVTTAQLEESVRLGAFNVALLFDYANYSSAVNNLPGLSGITTRGEHTGLGLAVSKEINEKLTAGVGYSKALGLLAAVGYRF